MKSEYTIIRKLYEEKGWDYRSTIVSWLYSYASQYTTISGYSTVYNTKRVVMIFDRYANLKHRYKRRNFCTRGYFVDTVGRNEKAIKEYIKN